MIFTLPVSMSCSVQAAYSPALESVNRAFLSTDSHSPHALPLTPQPPWAETPASPTEYTVTEIEGVAPSEVTLLNASDMSRGECVRRVAQPAVLHGLQTHSQVKELCDS